MTGPDAGASVSLWRGTELPERGEVLGLAMAGLVPAFAVAEAMRLEGEARALLAQGYAEADLVIVRSPLLPHGRVMNREQKEAHALELSLAVGHWVNLP